jgi:YidC/Oxa1 family membrane protein insertase
VEVGFFEIFSTALAAIYGVVRSYGLAIVLLTLVVRVVLLPLSIKQTKSMREMQRIGPELKKIQQKYKGDRQKLTEAQMQLYKEHGVNPFGGCAPLLLQFPVLIALYYVIRAPLRYMDHIATWGLAQDLTRHPLEVHSFLGLRLDCSASLARAAEGSEAVPSAACGSDLLSVLPYLLLIAVMGFTTYYQQRQMQAAQPSAGPQAQQAQMIMRIMPAVLVVIGYGFPAALVLYWTITNLWTIVQQQLMLKGFPPILPHGASDEEAKKPAAKPVKGAARPSSSKPRAKGGVAGDGRRAPAGSSPSSRRNKKKR